MLPINWTQAVARGTSLRMNKTLFAFAFLAFVSGSAFADGRGCIRAYRELFCPDAPQGGEPERNAPFEATGRADGDENCRDAKRQAQENADVRCMSVPAVRIGSWEAKIAGRGVGVSCVETALFKCEIR
jgi:hypothetical protein